MAQIDVAYRQGDLGQLYLEHITSSHCLGCERYGHRAVGRACGSRLALSLVFGLVCCSAQKLLLTGIISHCLACCALYWIFVHVGGCKQLKRIGARLVL